MTYEYLSSHKNIRKVVMCQNVHLTFRNILFLTVVRHLGKEHKRRIQ